MKKTLILIALAGAFAAHGGIKKAQPEAPKADSESRSSLENLLNNLLGGGDRKTDQKLNKHFQELMDGHKPGTTATAAATFVLRDAKKSGKPLAFATGVNAAGWLLTKASEVKSVEQLQVEVSKQWVNAKVVRTWKEHDLALIKAETADIAIAQWARTSSPEIGTFITAVAPAGRDPVAIGVVSVAARSIRLEGQGFLGVGLASDDKGLNVSRVLDSGAAKAAGVQPGDHIMELDGAKPSTVYGFTKSISNKRPGDKIRLKLQRGTMLIEKEIVLGDLGSNGVARQSKRDDRMNAMGSTVSARRGEFPSVIQTDFPLDASQCGGPVTDLDGNVVGMVIARSGRIETLVLPSETIVAALKDVDFSAIR